MITNIRTDVRRGREALANASGPVWRRALGLGLGDVNSDAMQMLAANGYNADCHYEAYLGPMGGGHNVCNVDGDNAGYTYGAELLTRPGGLDIFQMEVTSGYDSQSVLMAENARILAAMGVKTYPGGVDPNSVGYSDIPASQSAAPLGSTYTGGGASVQPATPAPTPNPIPIQTATIQTPTGTASSSSTAVAIQTAAPTGAVFTIPDFGIPTWVLIAGGLVVLFVAGKAMGGGR